MNELVVVNEVEFNPFNNSEFNANDAVATVLIEPVFTVKLKVVPSPLVKVRVLFDTEAVYKLVVARDAEVAKLEDPINEPLKEPVKEKQLVQMKMLLLLKQMKPL